MRVIRVCVLVAALLLGFGGAQDARAAWNEARTRHFRIYSDGPAGELKLFAEKLEKFDYLLRKVTNTSADQPGASVVVFMLPNNAAVEKLVGRPNVAGYYNASQRNGYAVVSRERKDSQFDMGTEEILFHEYAHHFMLHYFPAAYPAWYIEGFAEFYSVIKFTRNQDIDFGYPPLSRAYGLVMMRPMPVAQLFSGDTRQMNAVDIDRYYGTAWLLTHLFRYNPARRAEFELYLGDTVNGKAKDPDSYFSGGLDGLDRDLRSYLRRKLTASRLTPQEMPQITVQLSRVEDGQSALMMLEMQRHKGIEKSGAGAFAQDVRAVAAKYPQSAFAQAFLAETERLAGFDDAALAAADRAIALDPKAAHAYATKADILLEKARRSDDAAAWKLALSAIVQGNRADTEDAVPLVQFYRYHSMKGGKMPQVGYDGLTKAFSLVPQNDEYRFMLAASFASRKEYGRAARLLVPIAFSPHESPGRDSAVKLREVLLKAEASGDTVDVAAFPVDPEE